MHKLLIAHGDIKMDNILYDEKRKRVVLIDFGFSSVHQSYNDKVCGLRGSPSYVAPEVMTEMQYFLKETMSLPLMKHSSNETSHAYSAFKSDIYSLGVILYCLVYCKLPHDVPLLHIEVSAQKLFLANHFPNLSSIQLLMKDMFNRDPKQRPSTAVLLQNKWFHSC